MTHHKKFRDESQDARRHDQHNATHPDEKGNKNHNRPGHKQMPRPDDIKK